MKKYLLLFVLLAGSLLPAAAATYRTIDFTSSTTTKRFSDFSGAGTYGTNKSVNLVASDENYYTWTEATDAGNYNNSSLQLKAGSGTITSPTIISNYGCIIQIEFTKGSSPGPLTVTEVGNSSNTANTGSQTSGTLTLESSSTSTSFIITNGTKVAYISSIEIKPLADSGKPAAPTFSPAAGTYTSAQNVEISCSTTGATIYYTLDNTTPSASSTQYNGAINVATTTTIKAIAIKDGVSSAVSTAEYVIETTPVTNASNWVKTDITQLVTGDSVVIARISGTPYAMSNNNGTSSAPTAVEIALNTNQTRITSDVSANIKWTITVTENSGDRSYQFANASNKYLYCTNTNDGVRVGTNNNNSFIINDDYLYHTGNNRYLGVYNNADWRCYTSINNNIKDQDFAFYKLVQPTVKFTPAAGTYYEAKNVKLSVENVDGEYTLKYKIDNGEEQTYNDASGIDVSQSCTLTALLTCGSNVYEYTAQYVIDTSVATPTFSPAAGTYTEAQSVTLACSTTGAAIYYTTDSTTPSATSTPYNDAIPVGETTTIKAIAIKNNVSSEVATATYTINLPTPGSNTFELVTSTTDIEANKRYIIFSRDGDAAFGAISNKKAQKAIGFTLNGTTATLTGSDVNVLTLESKGNNWIIKESNNKYLSFSSADISEQTDSTKASSLPISITNGYAVISTPTQGNARQLLYRNDSEVFSSYAASNLTITNTSYRQVYLYKEVSSNASAAPAITVPDTYKDGNNYIGAQTVTITQANGGTVYYTTDGTTPNENSTHATAPVSFTVQPSSDPITITAVAKEGNKPLSSAATMTLTFAAPAAPAIAPASKEFTGETMESVTVTTGYAASMEPVIRYTTDGTDPTTSSTAYTTAIDLGTFAAIGTSKTVKAIVTVNGVSSEIATATYTRIGVKPAAPTITPGTSTISAATQVSIDASGDNNAVSLRYQINDGTPVDVAATTATVTIPKVGATLTAWAISADGTESDPATATYTYVEAPKGTVYSLVTSIDQIKDGKKYVFVGVKNQEGSEPRALCGRNGNSSSNEAAIQVEITNNQLKYTPGVSQFTPFTFVKEVIDGVDYYNFHAAEYYLSAASSNTSELRHDQNTIDDKTRATIAINSSTHEATVRFKSNSYFLQLNSISNIFSTYKESAEGSGHGTQATTLYLYGELSTTLAQINANSQTGNEVTVADDLQVVYLDGNTAYARDLTESNYATQRPTGDYVDYMRMCGQQVGDWNENNWVELDLSALSSTEGITVNSIIKGGTLTGNVADNDNLKISVADDAELEIEVADENYTPNVYCAANFGASEQTGPHGTTYFLMQPKPGEIATITWSVWNGEAFYMAESGQELAGGTKSNAANLSGGFTINPSRNSVNLETSPLEEGQAYCFTGLIRHKGGSSAPRRAEGIQVNESGLNTNFEVYPLNLDPSDNDQIVTAVADLRVSTAGSTVYYNLAGAAATTPWQGINIVVTTNNDGTRTVNKHVF